MHFADVTLLDDLAGLPVDGIVPVVVSHLHCLDTGGSQHVVLAAVGLPGPKQPGHLTCPIHDEVAGGPNIADLAHEGQ